MKKLIPVFTIFITASLLAPPLPVRDLKKSALCEEDYCEYLPMFYPSGNFHKGAEIRAKDLPGLENLPLEKQTMCSRIVITMTVNPSAPDSEKRRAIETAAKNFDHISELKRFPNLKIVILRVGERMFIKTGEKHKDETAVNLDRTRLRFEPAIRKALPGVDIRYCSWGW